MGHGLSLEHLGSFLDRSHSLTDADQLSDLARKFLHEARIGLCLIASFRFYRQAVYVQPRFHHCASRSLTAADLLRISGSTSLGLTLRSSQVPFFWSAGALRPDDVDDAFLLSILNEAKLAKGIGVPIFGSTSSKTTVLFAFEGSDTVDDGMALPVALALMLADQLKRLTAAPPDVLLNRMAASRVAPLSPRESEIVAWIALGKSSWETSRILGISEHTVNQHIENLVKKLGARNRTEAVTLALLIHKLDLTQFDAAAEPDPPHP